MYVLVSKVITKKAHAQESNFIRNNRIIYSFTLFYCGSVFFYWLYFCRLYRFTFSALNRLYCLIKKSSVQRSSDNPSSFSNCVRLLIRGIRMDIVSHLDTDDRSHCLRIENPLYRKLSNRVVED